MDSCEEVRALCEELGEYVEMEGAEAGQYWQDLIDLEGYSTYMMSDKFFKAYMAELKSQLKDIKSNYKVVETTTSETITTTYRYLEFKTGDDDE